MKRRLPNYILACIQATDLLFPVGHARIASGALTCRMSIPLETLILSTSLLPGAYIYMKNCSNSNDKFALTFL